MNRDEDLLWAQASRLGPGWYAPEDWGTWARFPECSRLYYVNPDPGTREVIIYERVRVVGILVGSTLAVSLNDGLASEYKIEHDRFVIRVIGPVDAGPDGLAELHLHYRITAPGDVTKALDEIDGRRLGLGIESTIVLQDCDILRRLAIMETIVAGGAARRGPVRPVAEARPPASRRAKAVKAPVPIETPAEPAQSFEGFGYERTLDAPKVEIAERVLISQETFLRSDLPVSAVLGRGWYPVETEAVWSNSLEATVNFRLPATADRVFMLSVEFRCLASPEQPASLSIAINDTLAWNDTVRSGEFHHKRFIIDSAVSPYDSAFVLLFQCDRLITPAQLGQGDDNRMLGIQLRAFSPEPMPSLPTKVVHNVLPDSVAERALVNGWYPIEQSGAWSMAEGGRIVCSVDVGTSGGQKNVRLTLFGRVFGTAMTGAALVDLMVHGQVLSSWRFENDSAQTQTAILPVLAIGDRMVLDLTLVRRDAISPADMSDSDDRRRLGILVYELGIEDIVVKMSSTEDETVAALA